ncbi:MAG: hypothetical protein GY757_13030 [bacterium]|nr:hypothetical protein [bacterium]
MNAKKTLFAVVIILFVLVPFLHAVSVSTTTKYQEHSNWCWDASCQMCFTNYNKNYSQCSIANYIFGRSDCCGVSTFNWSHTCNQGGTVYDMRDTLTAGGVSNSYTFSGFSWSNVTYQISTRGRPFIMCWYWTGGGGHAIVGAGYTTYYGTQYVYSKDPWPGEGPQWQTYSYCYSASDHTWGATVYCQ